jgi:transposase
MILKLSQLREDYKATYKINWEVAKKISVLIEVTKIELSNQEKMAQGAKRIALSDILKAAKTSTRTLQRWKKSYLDKNIYGLCSKKKGHKKRIEIDEKAQGKIKFYRETYRWGSEVIQAHLREDHKIVISRFKIDRYLKESGLRKKYPCSTIKKKMALKKKKHIKKVVVDTPGKHTQMDVKYQTHLLGNKNKAYVFNIVDHASNWSYKKAYDRITAKNTDDFMRRVLKECPFDIKRLQTDNGIEFTFKWTSKNPDDPREHPLLKLCAEEDIVHKLIPPGEKELQGLVERSHRQDDQELFSRIEPFDLDEFNDELEEYYKFRNSSRRFKKLGWRSPDMWLEDYNRKQTDELKSGEQNVDKDAA